MAAQHSLVKPPYSVPYKLQQAGRDMRSQRGRSTMFGWLAELLLGHARWVAAGMETLAS